MFVSIDFTYKCIYNLIIASYFPTGGKSKGKNSPAGGGGIFCFIISPEFPFVVGKTYDVIK